MYETPACIALWMSVEVSLMTCVWDRKRTGREQSLHMRGQASRKQHPASDALWVFV